MKRAHGSAKCIKSMKGVRFGNNPEMKGSSNYGTKAEI
jgi:hypothetical protein